MALKPDGNYALIANRMSNDISVVDMASGEVAATISGVGDKPANIDVSPDGRRAYVVLIGKRVADDPPQRLSGKDAGLSVIDLVTKKKLATIKLGGDPYGLAVKK